jgi:nucleotide-binding universal stress UspA family protein
MEHTDLIGSVVVGVEVTTRVALPSMVVVGAHRRGRVTSLLLGSASRSVVEPTRCTTVVVPTGAP